MAVTDEEIAEKMSGLDVEDKPEAQGGDEALGGEKKKKKKKKIATEDLGELLAGATDNADAAEAAPLDLGLKKKKKKKTKVREDDDFGDEAAPVEQTGDDDSSANRLPWDGTDRDYHYDELLGRVFNILRENNPDLAGERRRTIIKPPQVVREGTKKTVCTNFMQLCKDLNRQPEHVQQFLLAELGTSGSLDGQMRLTVKGRFQPKNFEGVLRRYVNEYLLCMSCKSADTLLDRDSATRTTFLRCQQCGASRTVAAIKTGFVARTTRRPKV